MLELLIQQQHLKDFVFSTLEGKNRDTMGKTIKDFEGRKG